MPRISTLQKRATAVFIATFAAAMLGACGGGGLMDTSGSPADPAAPPAGAMSPSPSSSSSPAPGSVPATPEDRTQETSLPVEPPRQWTNEAPTNASTAASADTGAQ